MLLLLSHFSKRASALACICALALSSAWAEKADRSKPMNAEADSLRYDDVKQTSVFTGNVVITKGTMIIRADRVEVRQDNEGFQFGTATSTGGKRAFFRQKRDAGDEWIEGEAESIVYDGKADNVSFRGNANMRRLRGATLTDETQGALITYDNTSDVFSVSGGSPANAGTPGGRVRAVLTPRAATPAASASPSVPASTATLRPSTTIGGDKK
ncbi:lipopolysaccharide transport periplasmic protein LptA [Variovorax sp. PCZ-1]|uniref:lipopolysaccharide transport periplasmic protein LptA n=1 Tax=Variovorax sp. PCZ-1 TaxID=2835533 RepID=UPI001BCB302A|nr:lipopolysaccharide transport periplasmic protein LptA [Variovorax sp. PCZ-1]MBS7806047.1 lipopolysaccharide transport periplasmic protein LptA [Variovorax sp. PCZ-1]